MQGPAPCDRHTHPCLTFRVPFRGSPFGSHPAICGSPILGPIDTRMNNNHYAPPWLSATPCFGTLLAWRALYFWWRLWGGG
jgi:hypothetical protein